MAYEGAETVPVQTSPTLSTQRCLGENFQYVNDPENSMWNISCNVYSGSGVFLARASS